MSTARSIAAYMSSADSCARSTGPFVQTVSSAYWLALIERVALDRQLEVDARVLGQVAFDPRELASRVFANGLGDIQVSAADLKLHRVPPRSGSVVARSLPRGGPRAKVRSSGVRANVTTWTSRGARSAQGAGALVDGRARGVDVVDERQRARPGARGNAPRTLRRRASASSPRCGRTPACARRAGRPAAPTSARAQPPAPQVDRRRAEQPVAHAGTTTTRRRAAAAARAPRAPPRAARARSRRASSAS